MTPEGYKFSLKLHKTITHFHRWKLTADSRERIGYTFLDTTQILGSKFGVGSVYPITFPHC